MRYPLFKSIILSVFLLYNFTCQLAQANVTAGYQALKNESFDDSFKYFQQSAHLGITEAQLNLANLYNKGIGCKRNQIMSYVYVALADDHGHDKLKPLLTSMFAKFNSEQQTKAQNLWQQYQAKYGYQALNNNIAPQLVDKKIRYTKVRQKKREKDANFSNDSPRRSKLSSVILNYDIGFDGKVRDIEVDKNYFMQALAVDEIIDTTALTSFKPSSIGNNSGKKVKHFNQQSIWAQRTVSMHYVRNKAPELYRELKKLKKAAEQGQAYAQYHLAMLYLVFPALDVNTVNYVDYIKKSAKAAFPEAELEYAKLLLEGKHVPRDFEQAISHIY